jgi:hypothetical protein
MKLKGYRKKPKYIYFLGILYFLIPFITLYQFFLSVGQSFDLVKELIFSKFYLLEVFFAFTAGIAVLAVTKIGFFYFIAISIYTIGVKVYNLQCYSFMEYPFDCLIILGLFIVTSLFLFTNLRIPYLNPKIRWWRQPPRYSHQMQGVLTVAGEEFPVITLNLSLGGVFIELDEENIKDISIKEKFLVYLHNKGRVVDLKIDMIPEGREIFQEQKLLRRARVVWYLEKDETYKTGLGLQFIGQSSKEKRKLKRYIKLIKLLQLDLRR